MIFDKYGNLLNSDGAKLNNALCDNFDPYCFTATMLCEKGSNVEFRGALSKASALVKQILQAEHPRTLTCFLEVFIHLIQNGHPDVTSFLRKFIKKMSKILSRLLGDLDSENVEQAMAQLWKCTTNTFDSQLGLTSRLAVSVRLDYIKRVVTNNLEEERRLRDLLAQVGDIPSLPTPRVMLNLARNLNRQGHYDGAEEIACKVYLLLVENDMYASRVSERIECLKTCSLNYYGQGKAQLAEQTMRTARRNIEDTWGLQHSWVPEFKYVLEGWLRGSGRNDDADALYGEVQKSMEED